MFLQISGMDHIWRMATLQLSPLRGGQAVRVNPLSLVGTVAMHLLYYLLCMVGDATEECPKQDDWKIKTSVGAPLQKSVIFMREIQVINLESY